MQRRQDVQPWDGYSKVVTRVTKLELFTNMDQAEQAFVTTFLNTLSSQPVIYADDYQQPPQQSLKKVPVLPVSLSQHRWYD
jgi:hypothetical protein